MKKWKKFCKKCISKVKRFFYEIFRPHTREEYASVLNFRHGEAPTRAYPWFWSRVLVVTLALTAMFCIVIRDNWYPPETLKLLGSAFLALPFVILLYESVSNTERTLYSLLWVSLFLCELSELLLMVIHIATPDISDFWKDVRAGVGEEFVKAFPCIVLLAVTKMKKPGDGFLLGAFAGFWFSVFESMGKIVRLDISSMLMRNLMQLAAGHILWTAVICWAFVYFSHSLRNFRFWGVVVLSMLGHTVWDWNCSDYIPCIPGCSMAFCDVLYDVINHGVSIALSLYAIRTSNRFGRLPPVEGAGEPQPVSVYSPLSSRRKAAVACALTLGLLSLQCMGLIYSRLSLKENVWKYEKRDYGTLEEYRDWMQMGRNIPVDLHRPLDSSATLEMAHYEKGMLIRAAQKVVLSDSEYLLYNYYLYPEENAEEAGSSGVPEWETWVEYYEKNSELGEYDQASWNELVKISENDLNGNPEESEVVFDIRNMHTPYVPVEQSSDVLTREIQEPPYTVLADGLSEEAVEQYCSVFGEEPFLENGRVVQYFSYRISVMHWSFWVHLGCLIVTALAGGAYIAAMLLRANPERLTRG